MNLKLLIDGIVRQTTVLIAQPSTTAGARAPLSRVADQVFLELAREIEAQGVRRQVVAEMFGRALRSYQKKMQRLTERVYDLLRTIRLQAQALWDEAAAYDEATPPEPNDSARVSFYVGQTLDGSQGHGSSEPRSER